MSTQAQLVERHPGVIDLAINNNPAFQSVRVGAALTTTAALAGTTAMMTVPTGATFRSRTLRRNRINLVEESNRGLTRIAYDPTDFASATIPGDTQVVFLRVRGIDYGGVVLAEGPILIVPPPGFFQSGRRALIVNGTAPDVSALASNLPPQDAMWLDLPKFSARIEIHNNDGANGLAVSLGEGTQEFIIAFGESQTFEQAGASLISLRGVGGAVVFRATFALVNGIQG
tara:strand:+ start:2061 stop:2747 length:687 start_codon:yes stop_codon:yes gene_type:complete